MRPYDYWLNPVVGREMCYEHQSNPSIEDYEQKNSNVLKYVDNQLFKLYVMKEHFSKLCRSLREKEPRFYLYSNLNQWKFFFNDHSYWDTGSRVVDIWDMGEILDSPSFITYAVDTFGDINPYVISCEMAMMRSASGFKDFMAGLFFWKVYV